MNIKTKLWQYLYAASCAAATFGLIIGAIIGTLFFVLLVLYTPVLMWFVKSSEHYHYPEIVWK